jgi:predicted transcriptional regulator
MEKMLKAIKVNQIRLGLSQAEIAREIDIPATAMSKVYSGKRDLSYSEVQMIVDLLMRKKTVIPSDLDSVSYASNFDDLLWVWDDDVISEIAEKMYQRGYSQLPVKSRSTEQFIGIVTELEIVKKMLNPEKTIGSLSEMRKVTLRNTELIEDIVEYPSSTKIFELAQVLVNYPAVLLTSRSEVIGIITRADLLKLLHNKWREKK